MTESAHVVLTMLTRFVVLKNDVWLRTMAKIPTNATRTMTSSPAFSPCSVFEVVWRSQLLNGDDPPASQAAGTGSGSSVPWRAPACGGAGVSVPGCPLSPDDIDGASVRTSSLPLAAP